MKKNKKILSVQAYGIRKFSKGAVSVIIASGMFFLAGGSALAD